MLVGHSVAVYGESNLSEERKKEFGRKVGGYVKESKKEKQCPLA